MVDAVMQHLICLEGDHHTRVQHCSEELAELVVALSHHRRHRPGSRYEVIEELADVLLTVRGVVLALGVEDAVEEHMHLKLDKLKEEFHYVDAA